jgi:hypothetical protein
LLVLGQCEPPGVPTRGEREPGYVEGERSIEWAAGFVAGRPSHLNRAFCVSADLTARCVEVNGITVGVDQVEDKT